MKILLIASLGVCGVLARYFATSALLQRLSWQAHYSTGLINLVGSLAIGALSVFLSRKSGLPQDLKSAIMIGFLGGFTTFSSWSLEVLELLEAGRGIGWFYFLVSPASGLLAAYVGATAVRMLI